jgi:hypothetical protein
MPEEVTPELGMNKTALRNYCRISGIHSRIGKRIMLHEDDIKALVEWVRARNDKAADWRPSRLPTRSLSGQVCKLRFGQRSSFSSELINSST